MADGGAQVKCAVCQESQAIMKRCTRCLQVYYCSRTCQVKDWQSHKANCKLSAVKYPSITTSKNETDRPATKKSSNCQLNNIEIENEKLEKATVTNNDSMDNVPLKSSKGNSNAQIETEIKGKHNEVEKSSSNTKSKVPSDFARNVHELTIVIRHKCKKHELQVSRPIAFQQISAFVQIPQSKLKLIHKGKAINADNIDSYLTEKALFLAIGEVSESEVGLDSHEVDMIIEQMNVDRNTAIKALRHKENLVDAILEIGNNL